MNNMFRKIKDNFFFYSLAGITIGTSLFSSIGCANSNNQIPRTRDYGDIVEQEESEENKETEQEMQNEGSPDIVTPSPNSSIQPLEPDSEDKEIIDVEKYLNPSYNEEEEDVEIEFLEPDNDRDFFEVRYRYETGPGRDRGAEIMREDLARPKDPQEREEVQEAKEATAKYVAREVVEEYPGLERFIQSVENFAQDVQETVKGYTHYKIPENVVEEEESDEDSGPPNIKSQGFLYVLKEPFGGGEVSWEPKNDGLDAEGIKIEFENSDVYGGDLEIELEYTGEAGILVKWKRKF